MAVSRGQGSGHGEESFNGRGVLVGKDEKALEMFGADHYTTM